MNLFSYVVMRDTGFAPNPFWGFCTCACCKPEIRRTARKGDLVVGLSPRAAGNRIVYVMRVTEDSMTFEDYWNSPTFFAKKPVWTSDEPELRCGDNIYRPLKVDAVGVHDFEQLVSRHSNPDGTENLKKKEIDFGGRRVLASNDFVYYGSAAIELPRRFDSLIVGRGHKRFPHTGQNQREEVDMITEFDVFFLDLPRGIQGLPTDWGGERGCCVRQRRDTPDDDPRKYGERCC